VLVGLEEYGDDGDHNSKGGGESEASSTIINSLLLNLGSSHLADSGGNLLLSLGLQTLNALVKGDNVELALVEEVVNDINVLVQVGVVGVEIDDGTVALLGEALDLVLNVRAAGLLEVLVDPEGIAEDNVVGGLDSLHLLGQVMLDGGEVDVLKLVAVLVREGLLGGSKLAQHTLRGQGVELAVVIGVEAVGKDVILDNGVVNQLDEPAGTDLLGAQSEGQGDIGGALLQVLLAEPTC